MAGDERDFLSGGVQRGPGLVPAHRARRTRAGGPGGRGGGRRIRHGPEQILPGQALKPVSPTYTDGRRWPTPARTAPRTAWRVMVSYWRIATAESPIEAPQARTARRAGLPFDPQTLMAMARQPLKPVAPQQPLDIGLFETRLPEAPHIIVPDE